MTLAEAISGVSQLSPPDKTRIISEALKSLSVEERKPIERLLRRLQHPEIPESFWEGVEDHEDDRTIEMDVAMRDAPPKRG